MAFIRSVNGMDGKGNCLHSLPDRRCDLQWVRAWCDTHEREIRRLGTIRENVGDNRSSWLTVSPVCLVVWKITVYFMQSAAFLCTEFKTEKLLYIELSSGCSFDILLNCGQAILHVPGLNSLVTVPQLSLHIEHTWTGIAFLLSSQRPC